MPEIEVSSIQADPDDVPETKAQEEVHEPVKKEVKSETKPKPQKSEKASTPADASFNIEVTKLDGEEDSTGESPVPPPASAKVEEKKPVTLVEKAPLQQKVEEQPSFSIETSSVDSDEAASNPDESPKDAAATQKKSQPAAAVKQVPAKLAQ